jgi:hypothetical protein
MPNQYGFFLAVAVREDSVYPLNMTITLNIPDEAWREARGGRNGASVRPLLEYICVELYKADVITGPQLQEMLGLETRYQLDGVLKAHGVFYDYSPEEMEIEAETSRTLLEKRAA